MRYYRVENAGTPSVDCTAELKAWFIRVFILGLLGGFVLGAGVILLVQS